MIHELHRMKMDDKVLPQSILAQFGLARGFRLGLVRNNPVQHIRYLSKAFGLSDMKPTS